MNDTNSFTDNLGLSRLAESMATEIRKNLKFQSIGRMALTPHYREVLDYIISKNDDELIKLISNDEYYKAIFMLKDSVSDRVRAVIDLTEIIEK